MENKQLMTEQEKTQFFARYNERTHLFGRIGLTIGVLLLMASPFLMGSVLGAMPDLGAAVKGFLQIAMVYVPSSIVEFLIYVPILGAGGSYVAFLTGNLVNMKIPCAIAARDMAGTKTGTPENEIVFTIAIATSALVTTLVIAVGALMLIPLQPILESPVLQPAFNNVVPALFGALAYRYFRSGKYIVAIPMILMTVLFILVPGLILSVGTLIILGGGVAIGYAFLRFRRNKPIG